MNVYATVDEVKLYIGKDPLQESSDDDLLLHFTIKASRMFDKFATNGVLPTRRFYPSIDTRDFDHPEDATVLKLRDDLLEVTTLTTKNGATSITPSDYKLQTATNRYNQTPYNQIRLTGAGTVTEFEIDDTEFAANQIVGIWGYHDDWANAWEDSGDTVEDDPLSDSATTITVNDADGDDINGFSYRFKYQQLLKVESEYIWVTKVDPTNNTLTVRRGMNGSTAAAHVQDTPIYIYRPMADVREAMEELATHLYRHRKDIGTPSDRPIQREGLLIMPSTLPEEVKKILRPYRKESL